MVSRTLFGALAIFCATAAAAQRPPDETSDWKRYRNETMGFEVMYPGAWRVNTVEGPESVILGEVPEVAKPRLAVQFWVQRKSNPKGLSIKQWYAGQLSRMKAGATPIIDVSLAGTCRSAYGDHRNLWENVYHLRCAE